jgi:NYN domain
MLFARPPVVVQPYLGPPTGPFLFSEGEPILGADVERFGIFVDAGYLFAASGKLLFGLTDRRNLVMNGDAIVGALVRKAATDCRQEHLRTYWYDGARDLVPTPEQVEVGNLPGVKLRLGRLTPHGQKGVDSRIVRDLIILSTERAIATAYLVGGDEDLREGVSEAQERGVRVVLIGVEPLNEQNLSPTLAMEADDVHLLDRAFIEPHLRLRETELVAEVAEAHSRDPRQLGRAYAATYIERDGVEAAKLLAAERPRSIPAEVDRLLLIYGAQALGVPRLDDGPKREMRRAFWSALDELD